MGLIDKLQASMLHVPIQYPMTSPHTPPPPLSPVKLQSNLVSFLAELELYRLEQRYARRKHRTTFSTGAQYVDGEYVYQAGARSPNSTGSKQSSGSWRPSVLRGTQESRWR